MTRRTVRSLGGEKCKAWTCRERHKGRKGNGCKGRNIFEEELLAAVSGQIGELVTEGNVELVSRVEVKEHGVKVEKTAQEKFTA